MKKSMIIGALFASVLLSGCANRPVQAGANATPIAYDGSAPFSQPETIKKAIRAECNLNENLSVAIKRRAQDHGLRLTNTGQASRKLDVEITNATPGIFVFGNFGSVPATLNILFKVTEGNQVILEKRKNCATNMAGFMGLQATACNKLNRCVENQAEYIARSLKKLR